MPTSDTRSPSKHDGAVAGSARRWKMLCRYLTTLLPLLISPWLQAQFLEPEQWQGPGLGVELSVELQRQLPVHVFADGSGLPAGEGDATQGAQLYEWHCAGCHGSQGQGGKAMELVGDRSLLTSEYPDRGIAVYWPHAPTLFEYVYRSMPPERPASLEADQLYSILAHLLVLNGLLDADRILDAQTLSSIRMPNRDGFRTLAR